MSEKIKIDKIDKKILYQLCKNSRIPETQLAKKVGRSKESVRYRIKQLKEKGIINRFTIWIDPSKLGYQSAKIYFNLTNIPDKKKEFKEFVLKDKRLFWLGFADGAWNAGLTYFVKDNAEFFEIKNELFSKFKGLILESHTANLVDIHYHQMDFLLNKKSEWSTIFSKGDKFELDEISKIILKELFDNSRVKISHLAYKYETTVEIIKHRIKKLEQKGIINRYTIAWNYNKLSYDFYKSFLYFNNLTKKDLIKLTEYCKINKNIVHFIKQISPWDIELEIYAKGHIEYYKIINNLTEKFSNIIAKVETGIMVEDYVFPADERIFE